MTVENGDLAIFHPDHAGYAHRDGETVLVLHCICQRPKSNGHDDPDLDLDRLFQVKARDGRLLLAFESELTRKSPIEVSA